jgi:hypothetical protein
MCFSIFLKIEKKKKKSCGGAHQKNYLSDGVNYSKINYPRKLKARNEYLPR